MKTIWFDMDGTIANLYDVQDWLPKLRAYDASPYAEASVMHNMSLLARRLNQVQQAGYQIGIISWVSMVSTPEYDAAVAEAKHAWLNSHLPSVHFDHVYITAYGIPKQSFMTSEDDILFDDNKTIRDAWTGRSYEPCDILSVLKELIDGT